MLGPSALFGDHAAGDGREAGSAHADLIEALSRLAALAESRDAWRVHDAMAALNNALRNVRASSSRSTWRDVGAMVRAHDAGRLLREDPITRRSVKKPRGYAGDAALLDLIYDGWDRATGARAAAAQAIHDHVYASPSCVAVRERRDILTRLVDDTTRRRPGARILAVAAGHLREADRCASLMNGGVGEWIALDQDRASLDVVQSRHGGPVTTHQAAVMDLVTGRYDPAPLDLAYAAGLYDYLSANVARRLTREVCAMLAPGGQFLFANFSTAMLDVGYMEAAMDWRLVLRTEGDMLRIAKGAGEGFSISCFAGAGETILYCRIIREGHVGALGA